METTIHTGKPQQTLRFYQGMCITYVHTHLCNISECNLRSTRYICENIPCHQTDTRKYCKDYHQMRWICGTAEQYSACHGTRRKKDKPENMPELCIENIFGMFPTMSSWLRAIVQFIYRKLTSALALDMQVDETRLQDASTKCCWDLHKSWSHIN